MSILSVNGDPPGDCPVWGSENGNFFFVEMVTEEKISPEEVWDGDGYLPPAPQRLHPRKLY
jgi:hypothetical protein